LPCTGKNCNRQQNTRADVEDKHAGER
jgi:hypothetical protein